MPQDLRTYLDLLINTYPDQLKVVSSRVNPEFEATAIVDRIEDDPARYPGFPAVLFKNVGGASMPVLLNLHATYERLALSIGTDVKGMVPEYAAREGKRIATVTVDASAAPVQEVVLTGDDIDVGLLPMLIHNELDAGKYITSACTLMKDPDSGRINAGIFRHQYQGPKQVGIQVNPAHHTGYILRQLREMGKPAEVALVIGHHPAVLMGAVSKLEGIGGELEVAGGLMGEPLEMVKAKTVDLEVPARAEIVIEGIIDTDPEATQVEGPFGEYPRYYTRVGPQPYVKITAITMRAKPIFLDVFNAHTEHSILGALPRMGSIYRRVKEAMPSVTAVNLPFERDVAVAPVHLDEEACRRRAQDRRRGRARRGPAAQARLRGRRRRRRVQRGRHPVVHGHPLPGRPRPDDHAQLPGRPPQSGDVRVPPRGEGAYGDQDDLRHDPTSPAGDVPADVPGATGRGRGCPTRRNARATPGRRHGGRSGLGDHRFKDFAPMLGEAHMAAIRPNDDSAVRNGPRLEFEVLDPRVLAAKPDRHRKIDIG